jgi:hypothetical protein
LDSEPRTVDDRGSARSNAVEHVDNPSHVIFPLNREGLMHRFKRLCAATVTVLAACGNETAPLSIAPSEARLARAPSNAAATFHLPQPGAPVALQGDGLFADGDYSDYADKVCGVTATVFAPNPTQDAVMQTDNPSASDRKCRAYGPSYWPRPILVDYGDAVERVSATVNVHDLGAVTGNSLRFMGIGLRGNSRCVKLQFGGPDGGDSVWVTRVSSTVWHVYSQAAPLSTASCVLATGETVTFGNMNVDFLISTP